MRAEKLTALGALVVAGMLIITSCVSIKDSEPAVYTSAVYKQISSGDCDVTYNGFAYKMNVADFSFYSWKNNSIDKLFQWATVNAGYDLSEIENQNIRDINSNKDDYQRGLNTNEIILMCNILSDMDGLKPAYVFKDGKPVRKLWNSRNEPVYTDMTANGWFIGVYDRDSFPISNYENPDYDYRVDSQNHLVLGNTAVVEISRNSNFEDLIVREYYYNTSDYSRRATSIQLPICRKASQRVTADTPLVANAVQATIQECFWPYKSTYHGSMCYVPSMSVYFVKNGATPLTFKNAKNLFEKRNIPFRYTLYTDDYLVKEYTQFNDPSLGLDEGNLARFANMLSEYDGLVPCYSTLDGQILREWLEHADRESYESYASGWHYYKSGTASSYYYSDVVISILESNGIEINYSKDLIFYRFN